MSVWTTVTVKTGENIHGYEDVLKFSFTKRQIKCQLYMYM